eukprot:TRINITY_DN50906_c0_g1_i1.p1 TRINITY_DN50906_c0_g1~~TRINITY_DN50906_c0_g1_i1.p1  ORF type:complete len:277 (+),score=26.30 TRINITY_DN50906_c0_g1_i1:147-977(+)
MATAARCTLYCWCDLGCLSIRYSTRRQAGSTARSPFVTTGVSRPRFSRRALPLAAIADARIAREAENEKFVAWARRDRQRRLLKAGNDALVAFYVQNSHSDSSASSLPRNDRVQATQTVDSGSGVGASNSSTKPHATGGNIVGAAVTPRSRNEIVDSVAPTPLRISQGIEKKKDDGSHAPRLLIMHLEQARGGGGAAGSSLQDSQRLAASMRAHCERFGPVVDVSFPHSAGVVHVNFRNAHAFRKARAAHAHARAVDGVGVIVRAHGVEGSRNKRS